MINEEKASWDVRRDRMRGVANNLVLHLHPTRVPAAALKFTYTWGLGGISTLLVLVMIFTGVLLMFRYDPTVQGAYLSIVAIETEVAYGSLIRSIHHWAGNLLLITSFLHLLRVVLTGGFKEGRAGNFLIGIGLLLIVVVFNFTGYLLPWDQLAYWAITVGTNLIAYIPFVGPQLSAYVLAGPEVGQAALDNFYALHVALLPALLVITLTYHFWKIRRAGGISFPQLVEEDGGRAPVERVTTLPHLVQVEAAAAAVVLAGLLIFTMLVPAPLEGIADPLHSPNPAKAAWYFAGVQELLLHMHPQAAMALVGITAAGLGLLPYLDRRPEDTGIYFRSPVGRRAALWGALLALDLVPLLVVADEYWLDFSTWLPHLPVWISTGLLPLAASLLGLALVYAGLRRFLRSTRSEAVLGLFAFLVTAFLLMTVVGVFFRGPNMALAWPW